MEDESAIVRLARLTRVEAHKRRSKSGQTEHVDAYIRKVLDAYGAGADAGTRRGAFVEQPTTTSAKAEPTIRVLPDNPAHPDLNYTAQVGPLNGFVIATPKNGPQNARHDGNYIRWLVATGEIRDVHVSEGKRRQGIATDLLRRAREVDPRVHHSEALSEDAKAWIASEQPTITSAKVQRDISMWRAKGFTEDVTQCEICGKPELKGTVRMAIIGPDGNEEDEVYAGVVCAAKRAGRKAAEIRSEAKAADKAEIDRRAAWQLARDSYRNKIGDRLLAERGLARTFQNLKQIEGLDAVEMALWLADHPEPPDPLAERMAQQEEANRAMLWERFRLYGPDDFAVKRYNASVRDDLKIR